MKIIAMALIVACQQSYTKFDAVFSGIDSKFNLTLTRYDRGRKETCMLKLGGIFIKEKLASRAKSWIIAEINNKSLMISAVPIGDNLYSGTVEYDKVNSYVNGKLTVTVKSLTNELFRNGFAMRKR